MNAMIDAEMAAWVEGFAAAQNAAEQLFLPAGAKAVNRIAALSLKQAPRFSKSAAFYRDRIDAIYEARVNRDKTVAALMFCLSDRSEPACSTTTGTGR